MRRKRYPGISYWSETDPRGGWRAVVVVAGSGNPRIHECATGLGADIKARMMAWKVHRERVRSRAQKRQSQARVEMWRKLNGYE